jgi:hypothetical protein
MATCWNLLLDYGDLRTTNLKVKWFWHFFSHTNPKGTSYYIIENGVSKGIHFRGHIVHHKPLLFQHYKKIAYWTFTLQFWHNLATFVPTSKTKYLTLEKLNRVWVVITKVDLPISIIPEFHFGVGTCSIKIGYQK